MENEFKSCCFTGYRPQKFNFELDDSEPQYTTLINRLSDAIFSLPNENCFTFYCGMAMGFDIIAGEIVVMLRKLYKNAKIELVACVPYKNQSETFDAAWKKRYDTLLKSADRIVYISKEYNKGCFSKRNCYMVDNSDFVITWYDGKKGGTLQTLNYAQRKGKKIINIAQNGVHDYPIEDYFIIEEY